MPSRTRSTLLLAVVCVGALLVGLGQPFLWEPDEPRFAEATRQMLLRGDLLTPWFNDRPRFEKPILFYWFQLPFYLLLGPTELAARLPSALAGIGCVVLTYLIGSRLFGARAAWVGALALAALFRFSTYARQGLTDVPALCFELLALHGFLRATDAAGPRLAWVQGWVGVGLTAATKGPVAAIPVAIWLAFLVVARDRAGFARTRVLPGLVVVAAIAAPWYLHMIATHGRTFLDVSVTSEVVTRYATPAGPGRGPFYYFSVWPADMLPWTPFFVAALAYAAVSWRRLETVARRGSILLATWFAVVVAGFSMSGGKAPHYLLPAYPAGVLLVGFLADRAMADVRARRFWWVAAAAAVFTLVVGGLLVAVFQWRLGGAAASLPGLLLPAVLVTGASAAVAAGVRHGAVAASAVMATTVALATAHAAWFLVPRVAGLQPLPPLGRAIASMAGPDDRVCHTGTYGAPGLVFYSRHRVDAQAGAQDVARYLQAPGRAFCVVPASEVPTVAALAPGAVFELASQPKLVARFNRLFGKKSPYEPGLVLLSNQPATR
jgi:4-amino-4-deoxy-L-arabinose transferase-like glycosyltransferase